MSPSRSLRSLVHTFFAGFCMGCADVVPGVSGGTMAFILGIYEELVRSIRSLGKKEVWHSIVTLQWKKTWKLINGTFLLTVGLGIFIAVLSLAKVIELFLEAYPSHVWSFFFGLVVASIAVVGKRIKQWNAPLVVSLLVGTILAYVFVGMVPTETPETWWFIILCGAIAICAMILPGVSGSFLLLILGKYVFILNAVNQRDIGTLALFFLGAGIGIILFAQILSWFLEHKHDPTIAVLMGLMIGSLRRIWPWKLTDNGAELLQTNVLPRFAEAQDFVLVGLMILGVVCILLLERMAKTPIDAT